ncbi:hypothetical protein D0T90_07725 [Neisseria animalis]|uniref:Uncharacterized protein n=1 Tax=Neisseria animalis TaxID=492 RepID=A0A5P3MS69_NEIAN|nr:hypothetical protein D0T90_07725 [Neisseria animalis]
MVFYSSRAWRKCQCFIGICGGTEEVGAAGSAEKCTIWFGVAAELDRTGWLPIYFQTNFADGMGKAV